MSSLADSCQRKSYRKHILIKEVARSVILKLQRNFRIFPREICLISGAPRSGTSVLCEWLGRQPGYRSQWCWPASEAEYHLLHRQRGCHCLRPSFPSPYPRDRASPAGTHWKRRECLIHAASGATQPGHHCHLLWAASQVRVDHRIGAVGHD